MDETSQKIIDATMALVRDKGHDHEGHRKARGRERVHAVSKV